MSLVQDKPRQASDPKSLKSDLVEFEFPWPDPQQGVIEEARRRQERRRTRLAIVSIIATVLIAVAWVFIEGPRAKPRYESTAARIPGADPSAARAPAFNIRLAPALEVGQANWQVFYEEHGTQVGSSTSGPAVSSDAYLAAESESANGALWTTMLVTNPNVTAILTEGRTRVPTVPLPGLPYGYRAARILTSNESTQTNEVPLDATSQPIPSKPQSREPIQTRVHSWSYPGRTPRGSCGLRASPMPGLTAQAGEVATGIPPFYSSPQLVGRAFLPCVAVEYHLQGIPLRALILLDAAHPSARAAALPDFKALRSARGFFDQGGITARREGNAWMIASQGSGVAQRIKLLRHLTGLVRLDSPVRASAGVDASPSRRSKRQ
ncbi:MAG: hypothetical protein ACRDK2_16980 [Solirubrobacteraceae bacterium]